MQAMVSIFRYFLGVITFAIGGIAIIFTMPFSQLRFRAAAWLSRAMLWSLGVKLIVESRIPDDRKYVIMANHATFVDPFLVVAVSTGRFTGLIAETQTHYPLWGSLLKLYKVIPIKRRDREAAKISIAIAESRLREGFHVFILPEGTRTITGVMGPLKKGGFHLAMNTKAPILPVGIEGGFNFKAKTSWLIHPGPITVRFGVPIEPEVYESLSMEELMEEVRERLLVLSGESTPAEVDPNRT